MIQDDPELSGIGAILFDEFHERHLQGDLGAAFALDVQANLRPDLRLVVMSATLAGRARRALARRAAHRERRPRFSGAHRASGSARQRAIRSAFRRAVAQALADNDGDVLVFLPGKREIEQARAALSGALERVDFVALHGELSVADQHAALAPAGSGTRRVILATNVAESSLTLPGIRAVVDTGLAREPRFDPSSGFTRLATVAISQASADQRAGRAGRLGPGTCYRLWPESKRLDPDRTPEIAQVELSQLVLELAAWGSTELRWLDAPPPGAFAQGRDLLDALGALDRDGRITALGQRMRAAAMHPRLAAMVARADDAHAALACDLAALVEARNPLRGAAAGNDDFRARARALAAWRARDRAGARDVGADIGALAAIAQVADASRRRLGVHSARATPPDELLHAGNLLLHAYPDRIARQDTANPRRYQLANGRGARLRDDSALFGEPWLVVVDLRFDERDSLIQSAAPFDPDLLERDFPERFRDARAVRWNRDTRAVDAFDERRFDAIVLERRSVPPRREDAVPALLAAVRELGLDALPWSEHAQSLRLRVEALRVWEPALGLPDFSDAALLASLEEWLAPFLDGKRRLDALGAAELSEALSSRLDYAMRGALDTHAPSTIRVPSGMERRIVYAPGEPPVLAVKLQELFGLADTPRIAGGRVPLTLHLLSPAGRPIQVTQDLKSFWERTYPEVKKELKGRYPKHPWPDDPWTAQATHRAKPRK